MFSCVFFSDVIIYNSPNTKKRAESATHGGVLLVNFNVFGNLVKHNLACLIYLLNEN